MHVYSVLIPWISQKKSKWVLRIPDSNVSVESYVSHSQNDKGHDIITHLVHEYVAATICRCYKAKSFGNIKPLALALYHWPWCRLRPFFLFLLYNSTAFWPVCTIKNNKIVFNIKQNDVFFLFVLFCFVCFCLKFRLFVCFRLSNHDLILHKIMKISLSINLGLLYAWNSQYIPVFPKGPFRSSGSQDSRSSDLHWFRTYPTVVTKHHAFPSGS